jgi:hypothetical protein
MGPTRFAAWNRGSSQFTYLNPVGSAFSLDGGTTWIDGIDLPTPDRFSNAPRPTPSISAWDAGMCFMATGYRLDNNAGVGVYQGEVGGGELTWDGPAIPFPMESIIPEAQRYDSPSLASDPERGALYVAVARADRVWNGAYYDYPYEIRFARSVDAGATWQVHSGPLSSPSSQGAQVVVDADGIVYVFWVEYSTSRFVGRRSTDLGASFGPEFTVSTMNDNLGTVPSGLRTHAARRHPLHPTLYSSLANLFYTYPQVAVDRSNGPRRGSLYVTWAEHGAGSAAAATGLVSDPEPNDSPETAALVELGHDISGEVTGGHTEFDCDWYAVNAAAGETFWMRGTIDVFPGDQEPFFQSMRFVCAPEPNNRVFATDHLIPEYWHGAGPPTIYTFPTSGRYEIAGPCSFAPRTFLYDVQFRRFDFAPGEAARDHRDIVLVSSANGGVTWSPKVRVNDDPPGNENTYSGVAVDDLGQVHVAWYDRRDDRTCAQRVHTYWAMSTDGGQSFRPNRRLSSESSSWLDANGFPNIGDHLGIAASGTKVQVLWTDVRAGGGDTDIWGVTIDADLATAISVSAFTGESGDGAVRLRWQVGQLGDLERFRLHRSTANESEVAIGSPIAADREGEFTFEDAAIEPGRAYRYRLEIVRRGGETSWFGPIEVRVPAAIARLIWERVAPNPFVNRAVLTLASPRDAWATVRVYDVQGHEVRTLHRGPIESGRSVWEWDGRDRSASRAAPGVYVVRAEIEGEVATQRLVHVR